MRQKLKMIWRILRDRQVVVITEDHGKRDTRSLDDVLVMCNKVLGKVCSILNEE